MLLLHPNEVVPTDRVIDELWGERPPKSVDAYIQNCVSRLRAVLGRELIETRAPGYLLRVETDAIDALAFERALAAAEGLAAAERAAALREALALWRGPALADFAFEPFAQLEISRLDELRLTALERRLEAELDLGRHEAVLGEIEALARRHPSRERLPYLQMLALYRAGRQRDALRAYHEARLELVAEFGLEPGEELRLLERRIIAHDPALGLRPAGTDEQGAQPHRAAFVLRLELDAAAREETAAFLAEAAMIVERHGGHVRALTAEEISAAFGPPVAHDDDALRALRAAVEIRAVAPAAIAVRSAIERVRGGDDGQLAFLLAQAASGELILGQEALRVVPTAVDVVPHESGAGFRVLRFDPAADPFVRHLEAPIVGREAELERLEAALAAGEAAGSTRPVVLLGQAGIGKTRLANAFVSQVAGRTRALSGRCRAYGDVAGLLPLSDMLEQLEHDEPLNSVLADEPEAARILGAL